MKLELFFVLKPDFKIHQNHKRSSNWLLKNLLPMSKNREKRTEILPYIRLTPSEKKTIIAEYEATKYPNRAAYIRAKLLEKTKFKYKEKVLDAEIAAGKLVTELNRLGNNINQIAKVLNTYKDGKMRKEELLIIGATAKLLLQIKQILTRDTDNDS